MTTLIDTLPIVDLATVNLPSILLPKSDVIIDDNETFIDQSSIRSEESRLIYGTVHKDAFIVLWFGQKCSLLRATLLKYLIAQDITVILFSTEEQLYYWLNTNFASKIASLVIETDINMRHIIFKCNEYKNIRSILVRCRPNELTSLQRYSRSYVKVDGVYADDTRVLIKLNIDLALFSEELGDQQREDEHNELEAQRHYDRALKLCQLVKEL